jgi:hypothetical protein
LLQLEQRFSCSEETSHVHVMAARVHHRPHDAFGIEHGDYAGVGKAGYFQDWERVHVSA